MAVKIKKILGLSGHSNLIGTSGIEWLYGGSGSDMLTGGGGDDKVYGGAGKDTAIFSGNLSEYTFTNVLGAGVAGGLNIAHSGGTKADGKDFVASDVECLKFKDGTIDLTINHAPVAKDDDNLGTNSTPGDAVIEKGGASNKIGTAYDASAKGNLLSNDTDLEVLFGRQTISVTKANGVAFTGSKIMTGIYGSLTLKSDGSWTYALDDKDTDTQGLFDGQTVTDVFDYTVTDKYKAGSKVKDGDSDDGKLTITITGRNDDPTAFADSNGLDAVLEAGGTLNGILGDPSASGNVLTNDTDVDKGDTKSVTTAGTIAGKYGSVTIGADGAWMYSLDNSDTDTQALITGQSVSEVFNYTMADKHGATSSSTLTVNITGANDAPEFDNADGIFNFGPINENQGGGVAVGTVSASDADAGTTVRYSITGGNSAGKFAVDELTGQITTTGALDFEAASSYALTVQARDAVSGGLTDTATVNVGIGDVVETPTAYLNEDFSDNSAGWALGPEWQIGSAKSSTGHVYGNADPAADHSPSSDNGVAGVVIGGNASTSIHSSHYLTSPVVNTNGDTGGLSLTYWRWLNSDYTPYMQNTVDVWNGSNWVNLSATGGSPGVQDNSWTQVTHDITGYSNSALQVRFGFSIGSSGVFTVSSWNVDDVVIG